jgi:hypothetical protein
MTSGFGLTADYELTNLLVRAVRVHLALGSDMRTRPCFSAPAKPACVGETLTLLLPETTAGDETPGVPSEPVFLPH